MCDDRLHDDPNGELHARTSIRIYCTICDNELYGTVWCRSMVRFNILYVSSVWQYELEQ